MKALSIAQPEVTREKLLDLAKQVPGAWIGLKIAALLLVLEGQHPGWISALFGLSRTTLVRWIHGVNQKGAIFLIPQPRPGRPTQLTPSVKKQLKQQLEKSPQEFGLARVGWDGPTLVVQRGTAEQWIKEGKHTLNWTRLSCHRFVANQVRLQLFILAYNLGELSAAARLAQVG